MKFSPLKTLSFALLLVSIAFSESFANELNIYSARKEHLIRPLLNAFSNDTGIKINLITSKDDPLLSRLQREGRNTPADILMMADAGRLFRASNLGLLQTVNSKKILNAVPPHLRDPKNQWFGLSVRSRVIFYNKQTVKANELSTYENLADPKWNKRICVRSSSSIYNQSLVASIIAANGVVNTQTWANKVTQNFARRPAGGDTDQIKSVAAGYCDIAIANTYYYAKMLFGGDPRSKAAANKVGLFWPNQRNRGAHVNISGVGVTRYAKNTKYAIKFIEYLLLNDAQLYYATVNGEYPASRHVRASKKLQQFGAFKQDQLNLTQLGKLNAQASQIMDKAGWR